MAYVKQTWENLPSKTTPITAARLSHMETQYDEAVAYVNSLTTSAGVYFVDDFGAKGDGVTDDTVSFKAALERIRDGEGGTLLLRPGATYRMNGWSQIYSNTVVEGQGATILKDEYTHYAIFAMLSGASKGYGSGGRNVSIRNLNVRSGVTRPGVESACLLALHHAENISVENCEFTMAVTAGHIVDACGSRRITVTDCVFKGSQVNTANGGEVVQADFSNNGSLSVADDPEGYDNLPSTDITVRRCRFQGFTQGGISYPAPRAFGSHGGPSDPELMYENLVFEDNFVEMSRVQASPALRGAVTFIMTKNAFVRRNIFKSLAPGLIPVSSYGYSAKRSLNISVEDNTFEGPTGDNGSVYITHSNGTTSIRGNRFINSGSASVISSNNLEWVNISSNSIQGSQANSNLVNLTATVSKGVVQGNLLDSSAGSGLVVPAGVVSQGNVHLK